jgi:hypothetical protein
MLPLRVFSVYPKSSHLSGPPFAKLAYNHRFFPGLPGVESVCFEENGTPALWDKKLQKNPVWLFETMCRKKRLDELGAGDAHLSGNALGAPDGNFSTPYRDAPSPYAFSRTCPPGAPAIAYFQLGILGVSPVSAPSTPAGPRPSWAGDHLKIPLRICACPLLGIGFGLMHTGTSANT